MADYTTTAKFRMDVSDLKKGIQDAMRQIKLANAEFKTASAGMDNWSKSADGLSAKIKQQKTVLAQQKTILAAYEKQLELVVKEYGENSKEADNMKIKVENQRATVIKAEKSLENYEKQLNEVEKEQAEAAKEAAKQETAYEKLKGTIDKQETELKELKKEYSNVVLEQGKESKAAQELENEIKELSGELGNNKKKLQDADKAADSLEKSFDETEKEAKEATDNFTVMDGVLANLVASGIKLAVQGLKDLAGAAMDAWKAYDEGHDIIIAATGASGETAEGLMDVYKDIQKNIVSDSSTIGKAVGEVNTRFGMTGDDLEELATQFLKFSKLNNTDVVNSVDGVQKALSAFGLGAEDAGMLLDALNATGQETGASVDTLASGLVQNSAAFQELGLDIGQSTKLMGEMEVSGADSSAVMAGLGKALKKATKDGKPLGQALGELQDTIKNGKGDTDGLTEAYELFGKSGAQVFNAVKNGTLDFRDLDGAVTDFGGNVENTFANTLSAPDQFRLGVQNIKLEMADAADRFMTEYGPQIQQAFDTIINDVIPKIEEGVNWFMENLPTIEGLVVAIGSAFVAFQIVSIVQGIIGAIKAWQLATEGLTVAQKLLNLVMEANPIGLVIAAITALVAAFIYLWNTNEDFRKFWLNLWDQVKQKFEVVVSAIKSAIERLKSAFQSLWTKIQSVKNNITNAFTTVKDKAVAMKDKVVQTFETLKTKVETLFNSIKEKITKPIDDAKKLVSDAVDKIKGLFPISLGKIFSGIQLPHFRISGGEIPWGIGGKGTPPSVSIDWYAKGGVFDGAKLIGIGEKGAEAVVPLDQNKKWIAATAKELKRALTAEGLTGNGSIGGGVTNNYNFTQNNTSPKTLSRLEIYRQTKNQLGFARGI